LANGVHARSPSELFRPLFSDYLVRLRLFAPYK